MKKPRILIVNSAIYLPGEGGYKRSLFLFDKLRKQSYDVTLLTGDFNHYKKEKRNIQKFYKKYPDYRNITVLHKKPYKKNISIKRFYSDWNFSYEIKKYVEANITEYDLVYINMPEMFAINHIAKICQSNNVPIILDIRDLFPESLKILIKNDFIYRLLTYPIKKTADKAYSFADELIAVSQEYLDRGIKYNKKSKNPKVVYIGSDIAKFDKGVKKYSKDIHKNPNDFWITYVGTLGRSYDLITPIKVVGALQNQFPNIKLLILGQGPSEPQLRKYVQSNNIKNVSFMGFLDYEKMAAYLTKSDLTLNCIKKKASGSIINKVADYFASGKPILNSCTNSEMQSLITEYKTGLNYEAENEDDLSAQLTLLYRDKKLRKEYGANARKLAEEKFDRNKTYDDIIRTIDSLYKNRK